MLYVIFCLAGLGLTRKNTYDTSNIFMQVSVALIKTSECASSYRSQGISIDGKKECFFHRIWT